MNRFAILFSGRGSNLEAILDHWAHPESNPETLHSQPVLGLSNRPAAGGLARAQALGLRTAVVDHTEFEGREAFERAMIEVLDGAQVSWIVLAGFMRVLTPRFLQHFDGRVLNTHPALLPNFPGMDGPGQAIAAGVEVSGCSIHFVDEGVDAGPVIAQGTVPVLEGDTSQSLGARIRSIEHELYPRTIARVLAGRVRLDGRQVHVEGEPLGSP